MKRPFKLITEIYSENLDKLKENQRLNFEQANKFMLWIVGFSIGGISLIVTNLTSFGDAFNHQTIKLILILLSLSIISGVVYRWTFYLFQIQYQNCEFYLQGSFSNKEMMEMYPDDLSDETDIKEVVRRLKKDYDEDVSFVLEDYNKVNAEGKLFLLDDLKEHYKKVGLHVKKEYEFSENYVKSVFTDTFGLSAKQVKKAFAKHSPKKLKLFGKITAIAFFISCLTFISVLIILCIEY